MKKTPTKSAKTTKETPVPAPAPAAKTAIKTTKPKPAKVASKAVPVSRKGPSPVVPKAAKALKTAPKPKADADIESGSPAPIAPLIKVSAPKPVVTSITAEVDVGFGNTLYIRGEGPGLSWDRGVPLESAASDLWQITIAETSRPIIFKFLVNDISWSTASDYVTLPGATLVLKPVF